MLYEKIEKLCEARGITVYALEKATGLSPGSIIKWKKSVPNFSNIQAVAEYFGVSTDYFKSERKENPDA